jgi:predicted Zn-dependent peptidase
MNRLAKSEYYFGRYVPFPEVIEALQAVTRSDLENACREMIEQNSFTVVVLGPVEENFDLSGYFGID